MLRFCVAAALLTTLSFSPSQPAPPARVPAIAFFTGFHADYHRPSDDVQRIDAEGGAHIAALAVRLVTTLAAQP